MTVYQKVVLQLLIVIVKLLLNRTMPINRNAREAWETEAEATHAIGYASGHLECEGPK